MVQFIVSESIQFSKCSKITINNVYPLMQSIKWDKYLLNQVWLISNKEKIPCLYNDIRKSCTKVASVMVLTSFLFFSSFLIPLQSYWTSGLCLAFLYLKAHVLIFTQPRSSRRYSHSLLPYLLFVQR